MKGVDTYDMLGGMTPEREQLLDQNYALPKSNSDNKPRPRGTFAGEINAALKESLETYPNLVLGGQLIKYGFAGCTTGLYEKYEDRFITYSVSESLMNSSAMGLALAGKRVVMFHVRMDFLLCGMDALFNHIPIWVKKGFKLPITMVCQVGKGMGQGAQHNKNLTKWFENYEGWIVRVPQSPLEAYMQLGKSIAGDKPVMFVLHRELFDSSVPKTIKTPDYIQLKGAADDR
jgi:pyruvate/2-oxoglutarate/acetoin dehydrogenase E1 component